MPCPHLPFSEVLQPNGSHSLLPVLISPSSANSSWDGRAEEEGIKNEPPSPEFPAVGP